MTGRGRDGADGLGMLQALGGSCSIAALWEGRQWEDVQSDSRQCLHGGARGAGQRSSNQLMYNYYYCEQHVTESTVSSVVRAGRCWKQNNGAHHRISE